MVQIDKEDSLYKYLTGLGVEDVDNLYLELVQNGRYKTNDVKQYFNELFTPSQTKDIEDEELEKIVDYYADLKKVKLLNKTQIKQYLVDYKQTNSKQVRELIINSQLKNVLHMCVNYKTLHPEVDIQDLIQIANIGLILAIEKYNVNTKIDFYDYVIYWIRDSIIKEFKGEKNDK